MPVAFRRNNGCNDLARRFGGLRTLAKHEPATKLARLTDAQHKFLVVLADYAARRAVLPSNRTLAGLAGVNSRSKGAAGALLDRLRHKGLVTVEGRGDARRAYTGGAIAAALYGLKRRPYKVVEEVATKKRPCLKCERNFWSEGKGNRFCKRCKAGEAWQAGIIEGELSWSSV